MPAISLVGAETIGQSLRIVCSSTDDDVTLTILKGNQALSVATPGQDAEYT